VVDSNRENVDAFLDSLASLNDLICPTDTLLKNTFQESISRTNLADQKALRGIILLR